MDIMPKLAPMKKFFEMYFLKRLLAISLLTCVLPRLTENVVNAQNRLATVTVSGHVTDVASGETLIGAGVSIEGAKSNIGTVTNEYGFYSLTIPSGVKVTLRYSFVGYDESLVAFTARRDTVISVALKANATITEAVVSAKKEAGVASTKMSAIEVPMNIIKNAPALLGEADVLKTLQLLPGVQGGIEGLSGIYVRGGGPDENLLLLDGISLYNAEHLLGLFSIFQPEAVKKVTLYKGSFPARYGGRISSIIDVRTNDGNLYETHGTVGVGLLSDKIHVEGPIAKGKTSFSLSGRMMHTFLFDGLLRALKVPGNYYFFDGNAKLTHKFSDKDRLFVNAYHGRDFFHYTDSDPEFSSYEDKSKLSWGNSLLAARWNHVWNGKLFSNATLAYTNYKMRMGYVSTYENKSGDKKNKEKYGSDYDSGIKDITAKIDFSYEPSPTHDVKFGAEAVRHTYTPETYSSMERLDTDGKVVFDTTFNYKASPRKVGLEVSVFAEDDFTLWNRLSLNPGAHVSLFATEGKTYWSVEPRLAVKYDFGSGTSVKAAYSRMSQYTHLLSSSITTLPVDLWVPITKRIKPVTADQYSLGLYYDGLRGWEFSVEGYYKDVRNVLEYRDGVSFLASSEGWDSKVAMGNGRAYGIEFLAQKTLGKATGWIGYTLAKSDRIFPGGEINLGERFPYRYDRRHNIQVVFDYKFNERIDLNATWTFASGGVTTLPERETAIVMPDGSVHIVTNSSHRNNYRLPPSHRLNVGVNFRKTRKRGERVWNVGFYNIYNQMNPNLVMYKAKYTSADGEPFVRKDQLKKTTFLPVIPSFSYTFNF